MGCYHQLKLRRGGYGPVGPACRPRNLTSLANTDADPLRAASSSQRVGVKIGRALELPPRTPTITKVCGQERANLPDSRPTRFRSTRCRPCSHGLYPSRHDSSGLGARRQSKPTPPGTPAQKALRPALYPVRPACCRGRSALAKRGRLGRKMRPPYGEVVLPLGKPRNWTAVTVFGVLR